MILGSEVSKFDAGLPAGGLSTPASKIKADSIRTGSCGMQSRLNGRCACVQTGNNKMSDWYVYAKKADFRHISEKFHIDPVVARILRNRDIVGDEEIDYFLNAGIDRLYDGLLMPDMEKAAAAVFEAVKNKEHIRIVGDYDIDGVCSTYILLKGLSDIGACVDYRIPDRINDGYGINMSIVRQAAKDGTDMILTCDNGIAAIEELKAAGELGMKTVVTDHHNVRKDENGEDILPNALAVVDVKRQESRYPFEESCGAVTAWKLIKEIYKLAGREANEWMEFLEFAAIATVGDIMKLVGENRIIVKEGLKKINAGSSNLGLRTLIEELELTDKTIDTYHIGFIIGPCINAGGRLETAENALKLFMCEDEKEAEILAGHLKYLNAERKQMTEEGTRAGIEIVEKELKDNNVLVVYIDFLHESLAGIVAGRLKELFYKPCFVITRALDGLKGSGRSIEGYDMFNALCEADELLTKYGGHKMAAGLSLKNESLERLRAFLNEHSGLKDKDLIKKTWIDVPVPPGYVSERLIGEIEALKPFGQGFERPKFAARNLIITDMKILGKLKNVLKLRLKDEKNRFYEGIMFGDGEKMESELLETRSIDIIYTPKINEYMGRKNIQMEIEEYRASHC